MIDYIILAVVLLAWKRIDDRLDQIATYAMTACAEIRHASDRLDRVKSFIANQSSK